MAWKKQSHSVPTNTNRQANSIHDDSNSRVRSDEDAVVARWHRCDLTRPWNAPRKDIARKRNVQAELFLVAVDESGLIGTVMAGFEGHRGWINYLTVDPSHRHRGLDRQLMSEAESRLHQFGCPKINLQVREDNLDAITFYRHIGFAIDPVASLGKRLISENA